MAKVLVTGGAGFIGSHVVDALLKHRHKVIVVDNLSNGKNINRKARFHKGDIRDLDLLLKLSKGCDAILHLAAQISVPRSIQKPKETYEVNVLGTKNVITAAKKNHVSKIIFSSSCAIFGDNKKLPLTETSETFPLSPYAKSKLQGEKLIRRSGIPFVIFRYFNVYGIRQSTESQYAAAIPIFAAKAIANQPIFIFGTGAQTRDFVNVQDVARANILALRKGNGVYNICGTKSIEILSLAKKIIAAVNSNSKISFQKARPGEILHSLGNNTLAKEEIGWFPRIGLAKGLEDYVRWVKKQ